MEMKVVILVCIGLNLLGVFGSAFYWDRKPTLRMMTILITTLSGCIYALSNPEIAGVFEVLKFIGISFLIGIVFYLSVWFQCKD